MKTVLNLIGAGILALAGLALADTHDEGAITVNCSSGDSLSEAIAAATPGDTLIVTGICPGTFTITTDHLTLQSQGSATLDGVDATQPVVTVDGAQGVALTGFKIQNGSIGILAREGAALRLADDILQDNSSTGIQLEGSSSAEITDCSMTRNTLVGLNLERSSEAILSGTIRIEENPGFGMILSGSSVTFAQADVSVEKNVLGVQVGINSTAFVAGADTVIRASNNLTTGFTVVAGSTLFVFEGKVIAENNQRNHGISANSNSNIDLDRGGSVEASDNGQDGIQLENSLLNLFNMQGFPGSSVVANNNGRHGVSAFVTSAIDLTVDSTMTIQGNRSAGVMVDNGSTARIINSTITTNNPDISLNFGSRAELRNNTIGSIVCDATVLVREGSTTLCP